MKLTSILFLILFPILLAAQMPVSELNKSTHARQLKEGILLVQLPNSDKKIQKLREMGNEKLAKMEEKEIKNIRKSIIQGFQNDWTFSDFLFFESKNSKEAFNKNPKYLFDSEMNPIKEFPNAEHSYSVRYGPGNPNGEVYSYNGEGYQIRYLKEGELQTIKYDTFFHSKFGPFNLKLFFRSLRKKSASRNTKVKELNIKLYNVRI